MRRPEDLVPGNCYFGLGYLDRELLLPTIETLVYVGQEVDSDTGVSLWKFQYPQFERDPPEPDAGRNSPEFLVVPEEQLPSVLDLPGLILRLQELATLHPLRPVPARQIEAPGDAEFATIPAEVDRVLTDPDVVSVTMTIRFTDDGLSIGRDGDSCVFHFHPKPAREPEREARLRALFARSGYSPNQDYLADNGRTRILNYRVPLDRETIVAMCRRVLTEVYGIAKGDIIRFQVLLWADIERLRRR